MIIRLSIALGLILLMSQWAWAQLEPSCEKNSPERRGEIGCSLVENKPLPGNLREPLLWHIDRFDSELSAKAALTPASAAIEAHGVWWLLSIEQSADDHHGGVHVAQVALPTLPAALNYSMLVMSAYIPSGLTSHIHRHSGVEAFFVVSGEQCLETEERIYKMAKGAGLAVAAGVPMRLVATGSEPLRALAVIIYDTSQSPTTRMDVESPKLASCR